MAWESTDKLNSWAYSTVNNTYSYNNQSSVNTSDNPVTFQIASYRALNVGDKVYCRYPYAANSGNSPEAVTMTINSAQTQNGTSFDISAMPMVSLPFEMPVAVASQSNGKAGDVLFYNVGSLIEFDIFSKNGTYSSETIQSVQFTSTSSIAGNFTMNLTAISATDPSTLEISGYSGTSVKTSITGTLSVGDATEKANAKKVYMVVAPGKYTGNVVVTTNVAQYSYTIPSAISFARAGVQKLGLNLEKEGARVVLGNFTWNLSVDQTVSASDTELSWNYRGVTMEVDKDDASTATNNYCPPSQSSTRFYKSSTMTITPYSGCSIAYVEFTATTENYASAFVGSTWSNATASVSGTTVTVTPAVGTSAFSATIGGTCGFTGVTVYYTGDLAPIPSHAVTFTQPDETGCSFTVSVDDANIASGTSIQEGKTVTLTATVGTGYKFTSWTVTGATVSGNTATATFTMGNNDVSISSTFNALVSSAVTFTQPTETGCSFTVTVDASNIASGTSVQEGKTVTLSATAGEGYTFSSWTVTGATVSGNTATATFTMGTEAVSISANFSASGGGGDTPDPDEITVNALSLSGDNCTIVFAKLPSGSSTPAVAGTGVRAYVKNTITVTATSGNIEKIELTCLSNQGGKSGSKAYPTSFTGNYGNDFSPAFAFNGTSTKYTYTPNNDTNEVVFTVDGDKGNVEFSKIKVYYK